MTDHDHRADTIQKDQAFLAGARRLRHLLTNPFAIGFLGVAGAAILFRMGIALGEAVYVAFDGDGAMAAAFGAALVTVLALIVVIGARLDRRRKRSRTPSDIVGEAKTWTHQPAGSAAATWED